MMTSAAKRLYLLIASLAVLTALIAVTVAVRSSTQATAATSFRVSTLAGPVTYNDGSIRLDVPATDSVASAVPSITPAQALSVYQKDGAPPGLDQLGNVPNIELAVFSDDNYGKIDDSGKITPDFQNVLSWIIFFHGVEMIPTGPPQSDATGSVATYPLCDAIQVINASTGAFMLAIQTCEHVADASTD